MTTSIQRLLRWPLFAVCSLILVLLLVACSTGPDLVPTGSTIPPTPSPTPKPSLSTFTGNGFTIGYPRGWTPQQTAIGEMITAPDGLTSLIVLSGPNPNGFISASGFLNTALQNARLAIKFTGSTNLQIINTQPTATINDNTWSQGAVMVTGQFNGRMLAAKFYGLAINHPAASPTTNFFAILYGTDTSMFDQINSADFQPMLQSFKFT